MKPRPFKLGDDWVILTEAEDGIRAMSKDGLRIIATWGLGWDHVSVSKADRCPTWEEMCRVKNLFWDEEECVIQYHPAKKNYRNCHPYCLHMWKPQNQTIPTPPTGTVAPPPEKDLSDRGRLKLKALKFVLAEQVAGRSPTSVEVGKHLGVSAEEAEKLREELEKSGEFE